MGRETDESKTLLLVDAETFAHAYHEFCMMLNYYTTCPKESVTTVCTLICMQSSLAKCQV